jgi:hypothetical protein
MWLVSRCCLTAWRWWFEHRELAASGELAKGLAPARAGQGKFICIGLNYPDHGGEWCYATRASGLQANGPAPQGPRMIRGKSAAPSRPTGR